MISRFSALKSLKINIHRPEYKYLQWKLASSALMYHQIKYTTHVDINALVLDAARSKIEYIMITDVHYADD